MIPFPLPIPGPPVPVPFPLPPGAPSPGNVIQAGINAVAGFVQDVFQPPADSNTINVVGAGGSTTPISVAGGVVSAQDFREFIDYVNRQLVTLKAQIAGASQSYSGYGNYSGYGGGYSYGYPAPPQNNNNALMIALLLGSGSGTLDTTTLLLLMMTGGFGGGGGGGMGGMDPLMLVLLLDLLP
jgi:hypothetical protein